MNVALIYYLLLWKPVFCIRKGEVMMVLVIEEVEIKMEASNVRVDRL